VESLAVHVADHAMAAVKHVPGAIAVRDNLTCDVDDLTMHGDLTGPGADHDRKGPSALAHRTRGLEQ